MEFFNKIKLKLKTKNIIWTIILAAIGALGLFVAISNGFSSEIQWQIGFRGSRNGIPLPNWLVSCFLILVFIGCILGAFSFLHSFIKNTEFNKMIDSIKSIGDVETIGKMLSSMDKNKYAKGGDLRFNESIIFYMKSTDVTAISTAAVREITTEFIGEKKHSQENFVCVYYENGVIKIHTSEKNVLPLLEEMRTKCKCSEA